MDRELYKLITSQENKENWIKVTKLANDDNLIKNYYKDTQ